MKFVLLDQDGEIEVYDIESLPIEPMTPDEQEKALAAWVPEPGSWIQ